MGSHMATELERTGHVTIRAVMTLAVNGQRLLISRPLRHARDYGVAQIDQFQGVVSVGGWQLKESRDPSAGMIGIHLNVAAQIPHLEFRSENDALGAIEQRIHLGLLA